MQEWIPLAATSAVTVVASGGFWAWVQSKDNTKSAMASLLLGLAYDKITTLGLSYIKRGWISKDEYEDFQRYLYEPYKAFGGNGVAERIMTEVSSLPIKSSYEIAYTSIVEAKKEGGPDDSH